MMSVKTAMLMAALMATLMAVLATGCGRVVAGQPSASSPMATDQPLIMEYFEHNNAAAHDGSAAQEQFLESTQHPDVDRRCDLGSLTMLLEPALSTLRPDNGWRPTAADRTPRGRVYLIAVTATVLKGQSTLGVQVGSMHIAVLDATVYGFAPCPS